MKQSINRDYSGVDEDEVIYSKVEVVHRLLYNRHRVRRTEEASVAKGMQICQEIFDKLRYQ